MAIQIQIESTHILLRTDRAVLSEDEVKGLINALKSLTEQRPVIIFDLLKAADVPAASLRILTRALGSSNQSEARIAVLCAKDIHKSIREQGLERILPCYGSLGEVVGTGESAGKAKTLEFLNTTLEAVAYTLQVATNTTAKAGKSYVRSDKSVPAVDIAAVVGLFSVPFNGSLILAFPTATYLKLMSRLLAAEFTELTPDIRDGAAELLNIILGQVKTSLNEKGYAIKQAIPTVVSGTQINVQPSSNRPSLVVPYETDIGPFYIELTTSGSAAASATG